MNNPTVSLPPDHWIIREFTRWFDSLGEFVDLSNRPFRQTLWEAFAAGAQCIPGNPERIAELERLLAEATVDGRIIALERALEVLEMHRAAGERALIALTGEVSRLRNQVLEMSAQLKDTASHELFKRVSDLEVKSRGTR